MTAKEIETEARELDPIIEERRIVGLLKPYVEARKAEAYAKRDKDAAGEAIKDWLQRHPADSLYDGETGIDAQLKTRNGTESYDIGRMPWALVKKLWAANALSMDVKMLRALAEKTTLYIDSQPWRVPGSATEYLEVTQR